MPSISKFSRCFFINGFLSLASSFFQFCPLIPFWICKSEYVQMCASFENSWPQNPNHFSITFLVNLLGLYLNLTTEFSVWEVKLMYIFVWCGVGVMFILGINLTIMNGICVCWAHCIRLYNKWRFGTLVPILPFPLSHFEAIAFT